MIREFITSDTREITIRIPGDYIQKELEILIFPVQSNEKLDSAISHHSANTISDWKDDSEDEIWN